MGVKKSMAENRINPNGKIKLTPTMSSAATISPLPGEYIAGAFLHNVLAPQLPDWLIVGAISRARLVHY